MPSLLLNSLDGLIPICSLLRASACANSVHLPLVLAVAFHQCSQCFATPFFLDAAGSDANGPGDKNLLRYLCSTGVTLHKTIHAQTTAA